MVDRQKPARGVVWVCFPNGHEPRARGIRARRLSHQPWRLNLCELGVDVPVSLIEPLIDLTPRPKNAALWDVPLDEGLVKVSCDLSPKVDYGCH